MPSKGAIRIKAEAANLFVQAEARCVFASPSDPIQFRAESINGSWFSILFDSQSSLTDKWTTAHAAQYLRQHITAVRILDDAGVI